jgi:hypothetical protein
MGQLSKILLLVGLAMAQVTRDDAVSRAKEASEALYGSVEQFDVRVEEDPLHWIIDFVHPGIMEDGERQHFSVWVNKQTGDTQLFKGR